MEAFESLDENITPRQVAHEWRASLPFAKPTAEPLALPDLQAPSFDDLLHTIFVCYRDLCGLRSAKDSDVSPVLTTFDDTLSQIASVEAGVGSLLALSGERAMAMLEAIQMVRSERFWCLTHANIAVQYLHVIPEHHPRRRGAIHLLIKLAHRSEQLPSSLFVEQLALRPDTRPLCGGFADVYMGILAEETVAVKKLRTLGGDAIAHKVPA
jgi:hypothetical protein